MEEGSTITRVELIMMDSGTRIEKMDSAHMFISIIKGTKEIGWTVKKMAKAHIFTKMEINISVIG